MEYSHFLHLGPSGYDVLCLQTRRRSEAVWTGELAGEDACLTVRVSWG